MTTGASDILGRLEKALDTCLWDQLRVIADFHEEAGDPDLAKAYRWLVDNHKHPRVFTETSDPPVMAWWIVGNAAKLPHAHEDLPSMFDDEDWGYWTEDIHFMSDAYREAAMHMVKVFQLREQECTSSKTAASGRSSRRGRGGTRRRTRAAST